MSAISDELAQIKSALDTSTAATQKLAAGVLALVAKINATGDQLSPETQAALDAVLAEAQANATAETAAAAELPAQ